MVLHRLRLCTGLTHLMYFILVHSLMLIVYECRGRPRFLISSTLPSIMCRCNLAALSKIFTLTCFDRFKK